MADARKTALTVLERCRRSGAWSDALLGAAMDADKLCDADRRLATNLCYGVLQNRMLLDHVVAQVSGIPLQKIEPKVLDILRLGAYQLLMLDRVPPSAAVDSAVRLAKSCGFARASGFVNAVLRAIASGKARIPDGTDAQSLSVRWSHPLWLTELYLRLLGTEEAAELLRCDNTAAQITIQTNTLRTDTQTLLRELEAQGAAAKPHPFVPDCLLLQNANLRALPAFRDGLFFVQDAAAACAVLAAAPAKGSRILDACAAPGGKTFASLIRSGGAEALACDLHESKLSRIRASAERLGLQGIELRAADARVFLPELESSFDLVLADVPCSGLGVIRKKPDIRYKAPEDFARLPEIQYEILSNVARYVRPGGTLLYSTCTIRPEENGAVVRRFLAEDAAFSPEDFTLPGGKTSADGALQLWTHRDGTDGFYIAKMRKCK